MSDSDFGFGLDCNKIRHILMKNESNIFEYNYLGGIIDIELKRIGGPTLLEQIVIYVKIIIKYILLFLMSKIEYIAIVFLIWFLIFNIIIPFIVKTIKPIRAAICKMADFSIGPFKVPMISVLGTTFGGQTIHDAITPLKGIMEPITSRINCPIPGGDDQMFNVSHGTCIERFGRKVSSKTCNASFATDFTLYGEKKGNDGKYELDNEHLCDNMFVCPNAPESYLISNSILTGAYLGVPMMGNKGIDYGSSPFKYLQCCNAVSQTCNRVDMDNATNAIMYANKYPEGFSGSDRGFDANSREWIPDKIDRSPFNILNNYSATTNDFILPTTFKMEDGSGTCHVDRFGSQQLENLVNRGILGIKIMIWSVIIFLLFIQIYKVVSRIYHGYIIQNKFNEFNKTRKGGNTHSDFHEHLKNDNGEKLIEKGAESEFIKKILSIIDPDYKNISDNITLETLRTENNGKYDNYYKFIKCVDQPTTGLNNTSRKKMAKLNKKITLSPQLVTGYNTSVESRNKNLIGSQEISVLGIRKVYEKALRPGQIDPAAGKLKKIKHKILDTAAGLAIGDHNIPLNERVSSDILSAKHAPKMVEVMGEDVSPQGSD